MHVDSLKINVEKCQTIYVSAPLLFIYNDNMMKTDETLNQITPTFVIDFLQTIMQTEITNPVCRRGKKLLVSLSDHTMAQITAPQVAQDTLPPQQTEARIQNFATLQYVMQHDYGYGDEHEHDVLNKLELRNLEECRTYIEDAVGSQLNAYFTNGLIEFITTGEKFFLTVELKH